MNEILLSLNIVWELALANSGLAIGYAAIVVALALIASRAGATAWRRGRPAAVFAGLVVAIAAFALVPSLSASSFAELRYWVDWANLAAIAAGFGAAGALFVWPLAAIIRGPR